MKWKFFKFPLLEKNKPEEPPKRYGVDFANHVGVRITNNTNRKVRFYNCELFPDDTVNLQSDNYISSWINLQLTDVKGWEIVE